MGFIHHCEVYRVSHMYLDDFECPWGIRLLLYANFENSNQLPGVMTIFNDFGPKLSGLHPNLTSMLWTLQFGEFWPGRPVKNPIQMWRASKGASRKHGLILMKKQYIIAVLMPTRD